MKCTSNRAHNGRRSLFIMTFCMMLFFQVKCLSNDAEMSFDNKEFKVIAGSMLAGMKAEHSVVRMRQHLSGLLSFTV